MDNPTIQDLQTLVIEARSCFETNQLICAGGAPRDILNNAPVKDIDLFVSLPGDEFDFKEEGRHAQFAIKARVLAVMLGCDEVKILGQSHSEYPNLMSLAQLTMQSGPFAGRTIEIIGLTDVDPVDEVHNFDFGLSQVFVTPHGVFFTEAYQHDARVACVTYVAKHARDDQLVRSAARAIRLRQKYEIKGRYWDVVTGDLEADAAAAAKRIADAKPKADEFVASDTEGGELS